ncbi:LegC family aminotransferase [Alkalibacillus sp. S2W]|uniref:LegC family aminotransferase n=1 Tax=Alkalibacillus sp. S2W TaxID=3386553 RepID=UPI00398CC5D3
MSSDIIPLSVPNLQGNELKYVQETIQQEWVSTAGTFISDFERELAGYVGTQGAVAVQNGTSGLHTALEVLGVEKNDEVIVPTMTFIAAVNPVSYCDAHPIFMDCDDTFGLDAVKLQRFLDNECYMESGQVYNMRTGRPIKAIVVVHIFGNMSNMPSIMEIADNYNISVIEDATEALGTYYTSGGFKGAFAGTIGTIGVYSFNGNKIMTTGGGGMIVSDQSSILERARYLTTQAKNDGLYYTHDEVGYNYRMTNVQAALGLAQLEQIEKFIHTKRENFNKYLEKLNNLPDVHLLPFNDQTRPNYWFYPLWIGEENREDFIEFANNRSVQTRPVWSLIHEQKPYQKAQTYQIEQAFKYQRNIVNIPCSTNLTSDQLDKVVDVITQFVAK